MEAQFSIDALWDRVSTRSAAVDVEDSVAVDSSGREAALTLESLGNCSDKPIGRMHSVCGGFVVQEQYEIRSCRCKSWFCSECAKWMGFAMRRKLVEVLKGWKSILLVTLTVDPTLFDSSEAAYRWVRERFGISVLMRTLKRYGFITGRYVWFLEFQKNGWPHWHIIVESKFIPGAFLAEQWGKLRPKGIELVPGRPLFGKVDIQSRKFKGPEHAANYGTKYLIKEPEYGWPEWVMDFAGRLSRYGVSRGFWGESDVKRKSRVSLGSDSPHPDTCFCEDCREGIDARTGKPRREGVTPRERIAKCATKSMLVRTIHEYRPGFGFSKRREVIGISGVGARELCDRFGIEWERRGGGVVPLGQLGAVKDQFLAADRLACEEVLPPVRRYRRQLVLDAAVFEEKRCRVNGPGKRKRVSRRVLRCR